MQGNPLENAEILVSNIELKEITKKDGGTFKQLSVSVPAAEKGTYYSLPIQLKAGGFTKAYEVYKLNKMKLDEHFMEDKPVKMKVAYSENVAEKEFEGVKKILRYRTIRFVEIMAGEEEQPRIENAATPPPDEMKIEDIPF